MSRQIKESDWKLFRELRAIALDRFCERVLNEVVRIAADLGRSNHERCLAIFKLLGRRNREMANAFDNPRRSTARIQLVAIQSHGLLTDEELERFSAETRDAVRASLGS
jgi:hypothetical protein